jgi:molybdopterin converting factor small subunit
MKLKAIFHGILSDWVGLPEVEIELGEEATLSDLLAEIGRKYSRNMPPQLWDQEDNNFRGPVMVEAGEHLLKSGDEKLSDYKEVRFLLMLAGG